MYSFYNSTSLDTCTMTDPTPCLCWYSTTLSCNYEGAEGGTDPYSQHWNNQEVPIPMEKIEKFPVVRCFTIPISFNVSFPNSTPRIQSHFPKSIKKQIPVPNHPFCWSIYSILNILRHIKFCTLTDRSSKTCHLYDCYFYVLYKISSIISKESEFS